MENNIEQKIRKNLTEIIKNCVLDVMHLCEEYDLDRNCMMQQASDMLGYIVAQNSFHYFKEK